MHKISQTLAPNLPELEALISSMRIHFDSGATLDVGRRKSKLKLLATVIEKYQDRICEAAFSDFHKPASEFLLTEIYPVLAEIKNTVSHLSSWSKPRRVSTNTLLLPSGSKIYHSPQGLVIIFAPWNYSFWLSMMPLVSAIGAGNVVLIKPAHETPALSGLIQQIVSEVFEAHDASVILGEGAAMGEMLLDNFEFDHIFFTGSSKVGKWILGKAAPKLTPVTLELGGKSPSIIDQTYDLSLAAKKIMWGKIINAGQTCVGTDYVLIPSDRVDSFIRACIDQIHYLVGEDVFTSKEYCHIINAPRLERLVSLLNGQKIVHGGRWQKETLCMEPTLVIPRDLDDPIMQEEIFGPILPIVAYDSTEHLLEILRKNRYPLSLYMFIEDKTLSKFILDRVEFGSGCFNNTIYQLGNPDLPFGGIRTSGQGRYHGRTGFETFSNNKSVLHSRKWFDLPLLYQPYTQMKMKIIRWFFMH